MATRKTTTKQATTNAAVTKSKTTVKKTPAKRAARKDEVMASESVVASPKRKVTFLPKISKKVLMSLVGLVLLVGLVFLGAKYLVVAWVNNKPITRFEYYSQLDKKNGAEIKDQLIRERLVADEAAKRGVKVGQGEADARAKQIEDQQGGAEQLNQRLQLSGLTRDDFVELVKQQVIIEKMFGQGINVTDEDVTKFIEDNKEQMPEVIDDKVKGQVREEIKQQKINEGYSKWLDEAMKSKSVIKV